jgi:formate dehydrogenase beta subunit
VNQVSNVPLKARQIMPLAAPAQTVQGKELEIGFSADMAKSEANRCLQCGLICYLHDKNCVDAQSDLAVCG